jgi:hypothetical protein
MMVFLGTCLIHGELESSSIFIVIHNTQALPASMLAPTMVEVQPSDENGYHMGD